MSQHLFIVSRQQADLYSYLAREFSEEPEVRVILDRRQGDGHAPEAADRRQSERRANDETRSQLTTVGYAFVRLI